MQLDKCGKEGCQPELQTRGEMGHGDYVDVILSHKHVVPAPSQSAVDMYTSHDLHEIVENEEDNKTDIRVCCRKCGKVTGWQRRDAPGMPGVGVNFTEMQWNKGIENGGNVQRQVPALPRTDVSE